MKTTFSVLLLTALFIAGSATALQAGTRPTFRMHFDESFGRLVVEDGITVVLTNDADNAISIEGEKEQARHFRAAVKKGSLYIWLAGRATGEKITVFVPARHLREITINGSSRISSGNTLYNTGMVVYVNGACRLDLRSMGPIDVRNSDEFEYKSGLK